MKINRKCRILWMRPGHSISSNPDQKRVMDTVGINQVVKTATFMAREHINLAFTSDTTRTLITAQLFVASRPKLAVTVLRALYPNPDIAINKPLWEMLDRIGNKSLEAYKSEKEFNLLVAHAKKAWNELATRINECGIEAPTIFVASHAVITQAIIMQAIVEHNQHMFGDNIIKMDFEEGKIIEMKCAKDNLAISRVLN